MKVVDSSGVQDVNDDGIDLPGTFSLSQNYPNPFNNSTLIRFSLLKASEVVLAIYNISGQEIKTLVSGRLGPGDYQVMWDGRDRFDNQTTSGVYPYRLRANEHVVTKKMILLK